MRPVIVCTEYRGVFFGYLDGDASAGDPLQLKNARCAIYWGTTRGLLELAETGPTEKSKISARADIALHKVTAVLEVTEKARERWEGAP